MPYPHTFATQGGNVAASQLDDNFNAAALAVDLDTLEATVTGLPSNTTPALPTPTGTAGLAATLARGDHAHPVQAATINTQSGTSYTLQSSDNGKVVKFTSGSAITLTLPNSLAAEFSCLVWQYGGGQITFVAGSGATFVAYSGATKTAGQYAMVTVIVDTNSGGSSATYGLGGTMV